MNLASLAKKLLGSYLSFASTTSSGSLVVFLPLIGTPTRGVLMIREDYSSVLHETFILESGENRSFGVLMVWERTKIID